MQGVKGEGVKGKGKKAEGRRQNAGSHSSQRKRFLRLPSALPLHPNPYTPIQTPQFLLTFRLIDIKFWRYSQVIQSWHSVRSSKPQYFHCHVSRTHWIAV